MKSLHRPDLFGWSTFDESRNVDFHGTYWRAHGGVAIDPLPMSDHARAAEQLAASWNATIAGPRGEREGFPVPCARWLADGDELVPGLQIVALEGSKTPSELALVLEETTLITGDLVRGQRGGRLNCLPSDKLRAPASARASIERLAALPRVEAVIVGDGWHVFRDGRARLAELAAELAK